MSEIYSGARPCKALKTYNKTLKLTGSQCNEAVLGKHGPVSWSQSAIWLLRFVIVEDDSTEQLESPNTMNYSNPILIK